jgi:uncharacterized damage-inducible protein DinB
MEVVWEAEEAVVEVALADFLVEAEALVVEAVVEAGRFFLNMLYSQYQTVKGSRNLLLNFCSAISHEHFVQSIENFGYSSTRNLLAHVSNASLYWLAEFALKGAPLYAKPEEITNVAGVRLRFEEVDRAMEKFLTAYPNHTLLLSGWAKWGKKDISVSVLDLFTHVITHEFHHKGQILSMGRHLGYMPVDTDVVRF